MPPLNSLVALYLRPTNGRSALFRGECYVIGRFQAESGRRKVWWHSSRGVDDPVRMRKHYSIWWYPLPECDGY